MNNEQCGKANLYRLRYGDKFALLKVRLNAAIKHPVDIKMI